MTMPRPPDDDGARRSGFGRLFRPRRGDQSPAAQQADHAWTVGRAVRALTAACGAEGRGVPAVHAVVVGSETVWLRLSTPDERSPAGWTVDDNGRTWHAPLSWLQNASVPESPDQPYPRLVGFGYTSQGYMFLNLGQAGGIVGLEGDARQARSLAQRWTREFTTNPWSHGLPVVRVGFPPEKSAPVGTAEMATLADAAPALADERGGVLLLSSPPTGPDGDRIRTLAEAPMGRWSVIVVGSVDDSPWRFTVDSAGTVESALLDEAVLRQPGAPRPARDQQEATAVAAAAPVADTGPRPDGRRGPLVTRTRVIVASVCVGCLLIAGAALASPTIIRTSANDTPQSARPSHASVKPSPTHDSPAPSRSASSAPTEAATTEAPPATHPPKKHPAGTGIPPGGTGTIRGVASGLCLDSDTNPAIAINGQPSGGHAFTNPCSGSATQQWTEGGLLSDDSPRGADLYRIVDQQTGFCLDSGDDGSIYTTPCLNPDKFQVWQRVGQGKVVGYRDEATNRCLTISTSDQTLQTQPCPGNWPNNMLYSRSH